jgi:hypothetical protein
MNHKIVQWTTWVKVLMINLLRLLKVLKRTTSNQRTSVSKWLGLTMISPQIIERIAKALLILLIMMRGFYYKCHQTMMKISLFTLLVMLSNILNSLFRVSTSIPHIKLKQTRLICWWITIKTIYHQVSATLLLH